MSSSLFILVSDLPREREGEGEGEGERERERDRVSEQDALYIGSDRG